MTATSDEQQGSKCPEGRAFNGVQLHLPQIGRPARLDASATHNTQSAAQDLRTSPKGFA